MTTRLSFTVVVSVGVPLHLQLKTFLFKRDTRFHGVPHDPRKELDGDLQFRLCLCIMSGSGSLYQSHLLPEEASRITLDKAPTHL